MITISENYSLLTHNTFHIESKARYFIEYSSEEELKEVLGMEILKNKSLFHIGGGSNILFTQNYDGVILHSAIHGIQKIGEEKNTILLKIGAGVLWDDVVDYCVENNLYGAENLSIIPGETGAAAVQNIGAYRVELKDIIESVETIEITTGNKRVFSNTECNYSYRNSIFKQELKNKYIITYVVLKLKKESSLNFEYENIKEEILKYDEINLKNLRKAIIKIRENKLPDPQINGNAGSFFMNPYITLPKYLNLKQEYPQIPHYPVSEECVKVPAAWLIEQCGWKRRSIGNASVYEHQSLVIINKNNQAIASDIVELSHQIRLSVKEKFDIDLTPEVIFL